MTSPIILKFSVLLFHQKKAFDNIFGISVFLMNTVLLKFGIFTLKPEVSEMGGIVHTCSVWYGLVVHVQKDTSFGFSLTLCTIFKISVVSFRKMRFLRNSVSSEIATF